MIQCLPFDRSYAFLAPTHRRIVFCLNDRFFLARSLSLLHHRHHAFCWIAFCLWVHNFSHHLHHLVFCLTFCEFQSHVPPPHHNLCCHCVFCWTDLLAHSRHHLLYPHVYYWICIGFERHICHHLLGHLRDHIAQSQIYGFQIRNLFHHLGVSSAVFFLVCCGFWVGSLSQIKHLLFLAAFQVVAHPNLDLGTCLDLYSFHLFDWSAPPYHFGSQVFGHVYPIFQRFSDQSLVILFVLGEGGLVEWFEAFSGQLLGFRWQLPYQ